MKCAVVAFPDEDKKTHGLGKWTDTKIMFLK